jgi:hypothetical protein
MKERYAAPNKTLEVFKMTTQNVINLFVSGATKGKASSISIEGDKLFNYSTVIAQRVNGEIVLNATRYSMTTTKHQNVLKRELPQNVQKVNDVPRGAQDLTRFL